MKLKTIFILVICSLFLCGCWDKVEIDRKIFISTIAIDVGKEIGQEKELKKIKPSDPFSEEAIKKINVTYGYPNLSGASPTNSSGLKDGIIEVEAYSMGDSVKKAASKSSRSLHFGHSQLLVLSSDILEYPDTVKEIIDFLQRQPILNRNMYVVVSEGKAEDYLKFKTTMEKSLESYISGLTENVGKTSSILPVTLNEFLILLSENGNAIAPRLTIDKEKKELQLSGVALIKNYALIGYLSNTETSNLELLRGKLKGGTKAIYKEGHPIDLNIDGVERKVKLRREKGKLVYDINLLLEGKIENYYVDKKIFSEDTLREIEKDFDKAINKECEKIAKITQKKYVIDPIGLREYTEKYHKDIYEEVKNKWDEEYKNAIINVNVTTKIRRIGVVK